MNTNFSVLMSVYYKENSVYLTEALNSIFSQTILPNEVVLVEDGKLTKELEQVISQFLLKFRKIMKIVKFEKNRGLGRALHDGLLECSNEIVFRMDSDDISTVDRFEKTLAILKKMNVDVVGSNIAEYDEDMRNVTGYRKVPISNAEIIKMMKKRNAMNHVTVAYKKSKVIDAGNYLDMPYFEDYYLWVRMLNNNCTFCNIDECLVKVRCGNEMIKRRGGLLYIKHIVHFEKTIYKIGFINFITCVVNILERIIISIVPNNIRAFVYKKLLRK